MTKYGTIGISIKVLDSNCKGIGGALVEVWYAGGDPGFPKSLSRVDAYFFIFETDFELCSFIANSFQSYPTQKLYVRVIEINRVGFFSKYH